MLEGRSDDSVDVTLNRKWATDGYLITLSPFAKFSVSVAFENWATFRHRSSRHGTDQLPRRTDEKA